MIEETEIVDVQVDATVVAPVLSVARETGTLAVNIANFSGVPEPSMLLSGVDRAHRIHKSANLDKASQVFEGESEKSWY